MFSRNLGNQVVMIDAKDLPTQIKKPNERDSAAGVQPKSIPAMFFSATKNTGSGIIYLKVVNSSAISQNVKIDLQGKETVASKGKAITIKAHNPEDTNSITEPDNIVPSTTTVKGLGKHFHIDFPAYSVTVLQLQSK
jgi:alpha-N-arabinofuranosidase